MKIQTIMTGSTLVSSAVPDRGTHKFPLAYTGLFQRRDARICVPVKCFYVTVGAHSVLIDAGWGIEAARHPLRHLGFGLWFASEPLIRPEETAANQLRGRAIDAILMTHLDCDHVSGLMDFPHTPKYAAPEELAYAQKSFIRYGGLAARHEFGALQFADDPAAPFGRAADVFGDGSIIAYLTPTHSAGSVIYKIVDGDAFALIVGDNGYSEASWKNGLLPGPIYDKDNMRRVLNWINAQGARGDCVGIFCAHDPIMR